MAVIDSYSETNQDTSFSLDVSDFVGVGQTFQGDNSTLDSAKFYLKKTGAPTGNATVSVYATTGTYGSTAAPTGTALAVASATLDVSTLTTSYALTTFNFTGANRITVSSGVTYALTIEYSGGGVSDFVNVGIDNSSSTSAGNSVIKVVSWATSGASGLQDAIFYVNGVTVGLAITTNAVTAITTTTATGNGNITDVTSGNADERGIVYSTSTQAAPGNVAPGSSGYSGLVNESGSFGTGAFTESLTGLTSGRKYYVRAYCHNSTDGYIYGSEVNFNTDSIPGGFYMRQGWQ